MSRAISGAMICQATVAGKMHNRKARRRATALARRERARAQISAPGFLRAAALGTVAAGAMMLGYGRSAQAGPDACITVGNVATCQGNQSAGIASGTDFTVPPVTTLNVNNLNQNIAPAAAVDGIYFGSADPVVINSDTTGGPGGPFEIIANGADGIRAQSNTSVTVNSTGNVTGAGFGINATSAGAVNVTSTGDVTGGLFYGIFASSVNSDVSVTSNGDITNGDSGIVASATNGSATVTSTGNITTGLFGIFSRGDANVSVTSIGNVSGTDTGIYAYSTSATANVTSTGTVTAGRFGILAIGDLGATVNSTGNVTGISEGGIVARSTSGNANVTSIGNVSGAQEGIRAESTNGNVSITSTGNVTASGAGSNGIRGNIANNGNVEVTSVGDINAVQGTGIFASTAVGDLSVNSNGTINAISGIFAPTAVGNVIVIADGSMTGTGTGIFASSADGNSTVINTASLTNFVTGIFVTASDGATVENSGTIISPTQGIFASVTTGDVIVGNTADVTADVSAVFAGTSTGTVSVNNSGNLTSLGADADALQIAVQIAGTTTTNITESTIRGGSGSGTGIEINSAAAVTDTLNLSGAVTLSSLAGRAITGGASDIVINNFGTLNTVTNGDILLGGGANAFNNNGGAIFNAGAVLNLGAGNLLTNDGDLSPGGAGTIQVTTLTGNMVQNAGGLFTVDADLGATDSDLVNVSGTANLSGNVVAQIINPANVAQQTTILSAVGGTTNNGLGLITSPAVQAQLLFPNANDVDLAITGINFLAPGANLNPNQTNLANNLNAILGAGGGTVGPVLSALLNGVQGIPAYLDALDQLIPEAYLNTETAGLFAAEEFNNNLLSCPQAGEGYTAVSQGQCMWVRYDGRWGDRDGTSQNIGYEEDAHGISGGGQVAVAPNWFVGVAAAYEDSDLDTDANASADTDRYMLGGVIKYQSGPVLMALGGSLGTGDVDMARRIAIGGFNATARSSFDVDHVGATFHAAYLMDRSSWYAKPFVDVNVTHIDRDSVREAGAGAANLSIAGSDETYVSVTPALELGTTIDRGDGRAIRPYVRAGVTFYGDTDQSLTGSFVGAPAGVGGFTTRSEFDDIFADIEAGLTLFHGDQHTVSAGYEGRFSDDTNVHGIFVKGTRTF